MIGRPVAVGVDASEASRAAAALGAGLARAGGGRLQLVIAVLDVVSEVIAARLRLDAAPMRAGAERQARDEMLAWLHGTLPAGVLEESLVARTGRPERVLATFAREAGCGIVVLGGKHHRGSSSWFRRGTAHHLLRVLDVPLLVTGPRSAGIARVIAAVDLSFAAALVIEAAREIAGLMALPLEALHVVDERMFLGRQPVPIGCDQVVGATAERLDAEVWPLLPPDAARATRVGAVVETLAAAVREGRPALLVVGAQGAGWVDRLLLGSTTEELLAQLPSSVLVVPCTPAGGSGEATLGTPMEEDTGQLAGGDDAADGRP